MKDVVEHELSQNKRRKKKEHIIYIHTGARGKKGKGIRRKRRKGGRRKKLMREKKEKKKKKGDWEGKTNRRMYVDDWGEAQGRKGITQKLDCRGKRLEAKREKQRVQDIYDCLKVEKRKVTGCRIYIRLLESRKEESNRMQDIQEEKKVDGELRVGMLE